MFNSETGTEDKPETAEERKAYSMLLVGGSPTNCEPDFYRRMPTLESWHFDNLVYEAFGERVTVSRMTVADGASEDRQVIVEVCTRGVWRVQYVSTHNRWTRRHD